MIIFLIQNMFSVIITQSALFISTELSIKLTNMYEHTVTTSNIQQTVIL